MRRRRFGNRMTPDWPYEAFTRTRRQIREAPEIAHPLEGTEVEPELTLDIPEGATPVTMTRKEKRDEEFERLYKERDELQKWGVRQAKLLPIYQAITALMTEEREERDENSGPA